MSEFVLSPFGARFRTFHGVKSIRGPGSRGIDSAEHLEWKALLAAVDGSECRFRMIDLGAGYGWWGINAAAALRARYPHKRGDIVMVEGEPTHYRWLCDAVADNPYPQIRYRAIHAAIGTKRGSDWFYVGKPGDWYGQRLMMDYHREQLNGGSFEVSTEGAGLKTSDNYSLQRIRTVVLRNLLPWVGKVDFLDMDIQGTELDLIKAERRLLTRRVKRLFISTHSPEIDHEIRKILVRDWDLQFDAESGLLETASGPVYFEDGQQFWARV